MARGKKHTPEQMVSLLRQVEVEVAVASGKSTDQACREAGIVEQTYYRWRKEYGGLQVDQAKRLKELEAENAKLIQLFKSEKLDSCFQLSYIPWTCFNRKQAFLHTPYARGNFLRSTAAGTNGKRHIGCYARFHV
jgi:hypothetical protein